MVKLHTTLGVITFELDEAKAPITVKNFLEYVKARHFDGTQFHRVIPGFMIQGGGFTTDFVQKATKPPIVNSRCAVRSPTLTSSQPPTASLVMM